VFGRRKKPAKLGMRRRTPFSWSNVAFPPPMPAGPPSAEPSPEPVEPLLSPVPVAGVAPIEAIAEAEPDLPVADLPPAPSPTPAPPIRAPSPSRPPVPASAVATTRPKLPAVRLGFSDGSSLELDDSSGASQALRAAAARLTGSVRVNRSG